jgi:DNA-binding NarL/FixJ family response regulator
MTPTPVLLVEDNPADAGLVRTWLADGANGDYEVEHVESLEDVATQRSYDVAILDLGLPRSHGIDTLVRFRRLLPTCPVVIFTGSDDARLVADAVVHDVAAVMHKDAADSRSLSETLLRVVGRRRRERSLDELASELRERLFALQAAADDLSEGLVVFTTQGQVTFANLAAHELLGVTSRGNVPDPLRRLGTARPAQGCITTPTGARNVEVIRSELPRHAASQRRFEALLVRVRDELPALDLHDSLELLGISDGLISHARAMVIPSTDAAGPGDLEASVELQARAASVLGLALQLRRRVHRIEGRRTHPRPRSHRSVDEIEEHPLAESPPIAAARCADDVVHTAVDIARPHLPARVEIRVRLRAPRVTCKDPERLGSLVEHLVRGVANFASERSADPIYMLLRSAPSGDELSLGLEIIGPSDPTVFSELAEALVGELEGDDELSEAHRCLHELDGVLSLPQHPDGSIYVDIRVG